MFHVRCFFSSQTGSEWERWQDCHIQVKQEIPLPNLQVTSHVFLLCLTLEFFFGGGGSLLKVHKRDRDEEEICGIFEI